MRVSKSIIGILVAVLIGLVMLKNAGAFQVGVVVVPANNYQQCVDTCLAYNGYTTGTYAFCLNQCSLYPDPTLVVVGPVWTGGVWYPHGFRHFEPRHDGPHFDPRYDGHNRR